MCRPRFFTPQDCDFSTKGIDVTKLKPGTKIFVCTINNLYQITIIDGCKVKVKGGKYFDSEIETYLNGSTWGGSMIKLGWIGFDMHMEFAHFQCLVLTSRVQAAIILGKDWHYDFKWNEDSI